MVVQNENREWFFEYFMHLNETWTNSFWVIKKYKLYE